jgi:ketosteroid isomerase-like protein
MTPLETVQHMYAAFGRGDVPAILACLAEDVQWEYGERGPSPAPVPWLQPRRGRDAVIGFFEALTALEFSRFVPHKLLADGPLVVALIDLEATVRATGRTVVEDDEVHLWHFDAAGKVCRFRHRADSWVHAVALGAAAGGEPPASAR